jgi:hypothetical protein
MPTITLENGSKVELSQEGYDNLAKAVKPKRWRAESDDIYYCINDVSGIVDSSDFWLPGDDWRHSQRNYFKTREEAEHYKKRLGAIAEYRDLIEKLNDGWEPDWDSVELKHLISYSHEFKQFERGFGTKFQVKETWYYLKSEKLAEQVIDTLGEEKLKLVFDIK